MHKMKRTKQGRGLALVMGLAKMHVCVCVLLGFDERLCARIDDCNVCVLLGLIITCVCVHDKIM
jgi:hypothetical protein